MLSGDVRDGRFAVSLLVDGVVESELQAAVVAGDESITIALEYWQRQ